MTTMQCPQFEEVLAQQPDGPLPAAAAVHLDACPHCRLLREDLEAIRTAGLEWGHEELDPPARIWTALVAQLESEGRIAEAQRPGWFAGWFSPRPRLALAGAYASLLLVAAGLVSYQNVPPAVTLEQAHTGVPASAAPLVAGLNQTLDGEMQRVVASLSERDGSLATSLQENLGIVDNLIAVCEQSVREHPADPIAREYLYGAYEQKADLLAVAMDRSTMESK
jgi:hypothetical protein